MEIEMKYSIPSKEVADAIWDDGFLSEMADMSTAEKVVMKAVYFDTPDRDLSKAGAVVRVRSENGNCIATVKWKGTTHAGFSEREEINIPVDGEEFFIKPNIGIFSDSEEGKALLHAAEGKELVNTVETRFLRRRIRVNYGASIVELAIDTGQIISDGGETPILELEIELFGGHPEDIKKMGAEFAERYGLVPLDESKYARGIALLSA